MAHFFERTANVSVSRRSSTWTPGPLRSAGSPVPATTMRGSSFPTQYMSGAAATDAAISCRTSAITSLACSRRE